MADSIGFGNQNLSQTQTHRQDGGAFSLVYPTTIAYASLHPTMLSSVSKQPLPTTPEQLLSPALFAKLDKLDLLSRKMLAGTLPGERRSKRRGRSVEFDDFRDYVPGDDLRHIDWNIYARLERLFIKLFREEEDLALNIIIDVSASMDVGEPNKLFFAHQLAFALAYIGLVNQNRVSIATFASASNTRPLVKHMAPLRGRPSVHRAGLFLIDSLKDSHRAVHGAGDASARGTQPQEVFAAAMRTLTSTSARRGVSLILSDFLMPGSFEPGLMYLGAVTLGGTADTYCLQVLSPQELDPTKARDGGLFGDVRLLDSETSAAVETTITPDSIEAYKVRLSEYRARLTSQANARGIGHFVIPTDTAIDTLILNTLRRGGLFR